MSLDGAFRPDYTGRGLTRVLPSIAARLGVPGETDSLGLPTASRYVVLLVDGLGWHQLRANAGNAGYLAALAAHSAPISCGAPSTTAASLASLGTGLPCGQHGLVGYSFRNPQTGGWMNALTWQGGPDDVRGFQPNPTWFERLTDAGHPTANVGPVRFAGSALTESAMRGAVFVDVENEYDTEARVQLCAQAIEHADVVYFYERLLDHTGHARGVGSWQWLDQLSAVDDLAADLRDALPDDVCLIITGDHGMVNVDENKFIVLENHRELDGYDLVAGEARFRHVYTDHPTQLKRRWASFLGDRAWVFTRDEGIAAGLFGDVAPDVRGRLGDVMVAMRDQWVLMTQKFPNEMAMVGVHGSLTPDEMQVPLLVDGPRRG